MASSELSASILNQHTLVHALNMIEPHRQPIVTGTSVLAIKYKDGIMMAADTLGTTLFCSQYTIHAHTSLHTASYGSLARFKSIQRLHSVGEHTVIGASGDLSDYQYIQSLLDEVMIEEFSAADGHSLSPDEIHEFLSRVMYSRRSQMNPLWNSILVGGFKNGKRCVVFLPLVVLNPDLHHSFRFLAYVDLLGTTYSASTLATGYGSYIAQPLLRKAVEGNEDTLTEEQARSILTQSLRVLFYRDARSLNKVCYSSLLST